MEKVALFVDVQNIYYTTRESYNRHFNYRVFWAKATSKREVVQANAYAIQSSDPKQIQFQQILRHIGFEVKLKPFIQRRDGSAKGDWDVGMTLDMIDCAKDVDVVVLASGDGDFDLVLQKIRKENKTSVEVYGVPHLTASSLINAADVFIPIDVGLLLSP
jgi:uncharacterized LabA/DUF88 family protein